MSIKGHLACRSWGVAVTHGAVDEGHDNLRWRLGMVTLLLLPFVALFAVSIPTHKIERATGDTLQYLSRVERILAAQFPYRDFPSEYPPLAFVPMLLPRLISGDRPDGYLWVFAFELALLASAVAVSLYWLASHGWSAEAPRNVLIAYVLGVITTAFVAVWRFDLFAAAASLFALTALARSHHGTAGLMLAVAVLAKLYAVVMLPVFLVALLVEHRWRGASRLVTVFVAAVLLAMVPIFLVAGQGAVSFLSYQAERGLQVESVGGGLVLLAHAVTGLPVSVLFGFGSWQLESSASGMVASISSVAMVIIGAVLLIMCLARFRQEQRTDGAVRRGSIVAYSVLMLLAAIITNKVLSPQYLVWLVPFAPLLRRGQIVLFVIICAVTIAIYPLGYHYLMDLRPELILILNGRNLLLVLLFGWLALESAPQMSGLRGRKVVAPA